MGAQAHRRYLRQQTTKDDKSQMVLCSSGIKANPNIVAVAHEYILPLDKKVSCPFCLGLSEFRKFLVSNKAGISRTMGECQLCGEGMQLRSIALLAKGDAASYAKWVFIYRGFWKKIKFNQWKGRLELIGWTQEFWDEYKRLKGEREKEGDVDEGFVDYINRKGKEATEEWSKEEHEPER